MALLNAVPVPMCQGHDPESMNSLENHVLFLSGAGRNTTHGTICRQGHLKARDRVSLAFLPLPLARGKSGDAGVEKCESTILCLSDH